MIKSHKRIAQFITVVSLGPIASIFGKHFMYKESVPSHEYIVAIGMCIFTFFVWYSYRNEKKNCQDILIKELDDRYVVTISKSQWDDMIVKITLKNVVLNKVICKTIYNPQYTIEAKVKKIKWKNGVGVKFAIIEEISEYTCGINSKSFLFEFNEKKYRFFYEI